MELGFVFSFVLFFSGGNFCSATQNPSNFSTNETLSQTPKEQVTASLALPRSLPTTGHHSNQMEQKDLAGFPVSYRVRSFQLRKQKSSQLEKTETVQAQEVSQSQDQDPDINLVAKQKSKVPVKFEERLPVPADSVAVRCGEVKVTIEVKQNFLGNGQLIRPSDLTLGGCAAVNAEELILQFQTELEGCGSTVTMTEETLIYTFTLMYSPTPISSTFIIKSNPAEVVIQCHYRRRHYVNSMRAEQQLHFSLHLMTEDWQSQRPSSVYFLNDVMHIEAAVHRGNHIPLRVYVDSCVATVSPDPHSQPSYSFISNHGCLTDAKLTGAKSYFMQRSQEDKLHFQLKAFRFHRDDRNSLYITCHLKAAPVSAPVDWQHKACSFLTEAKRWVASGGDNKVCSCCETSCGEQRWKRSLAANDALRWEGTAALGPILLEENVPEEELTELFELPPEPVSLLQTQDVTQAALFSSVALLCGVSAVLAVVLVFTGAVICSRLRKPVGYSVCT
ncbi:zona pellucida sperm-binding protein 3-like isoform X2 [Archocentrus centrarchus]|uniref:zona pellucida sperm-binding protein 3-like isoform X2 n=1 Tax=Archocentrus centrarchus TaxID=63155 RepID=UPI0011EA0AD3|nr:zona pellucida sperm-binding protein 3-like isoform X2 [Archocentrus centrarchus]